MSHNGYNGILNTPSARAASFLGLVLFKSQLIARFTERVGTQDEAAIPSKIVLKEEISEEERIQVGFAASEAVEDLENCLRIEEGQVRKSLDCFWKMNC